MILFFDFIDILLYNTNRFEGGILKGAKGGFWNLLLERFRMRRIKKKKIKNEEQKLNDLKTKKEINNRKKKEKEIIINYYIKENKRKYKLEKIPKKGKIKNSKKIIVTKEQKKKVVINQNEIEKKNIIKENNEQKVKSMIEKKKTKSVGIDISIQKDNRNYNSKEKENKRRESNNPEEKQQKNNQIIDNPKIFKIKSANEDLEANLIKELKKIIVKDKDVLQKLGFKLDELNSKLDNTKSLEEMKKIEKEIQEIIEQINELINNYNVLTKGDYKKLNNEKINNLLSKISNTNILIYIKSKLRNELDYYSELSDNRKNVINIKDKKQRKKHEINDKRQLFSNEKSEFSNILSINQQLNLKLKEQQEIYNEFNNLISKIKANKIVSTKYSFIDRMLKGTANIMTSAFSLKLLRRKNIPLFAIGLFMLGNSLRNMRKVVTKDETIKYIPSDNYADAIESNMSNFYLIDYMLSDSLYQVSRLKYEYINEFKNYHGLESYEKNLNKIINIEKQIINKKQQVNSIKDKMYDAIDKNNQKVKVIGDMNK